MRKHLEKWDKKGNVFKNVFILTFLTVLFIAMIFELLHYILVKQKLSAYVEECQQRLQNGLDRVVSMMDTAYEDYYSDVFNENEHIFKAHINFLVESESNLESLIYIPEQGDGFAYWKALGHPGIDIIVKSDAKEDITDYINGRDLMVYGSKAKSLGTAVINANYANFIDQINNALASGQDYIFPFDLDNLALVRSMKNREYGGYMVVVLRGRSFWADYPGKYSFTLSCPFAGSNNYVLASTGDIMMRNGDYTLDVPGTTWYLDIKPKSGIISSTRILIELLSAILIGLLMANKAKDRMTIKRLENIIRSQ